jgi:hypothetical protein
MAMLPGDLNESNKCLKLFMSRKMHIVPNKYTKVNMERADRRPNTTNAAST